MIDSIAQSYHWPLSECLKLTVPQVLMLTHASQVNQAKFKSQYGDDKDEAKQGRAEEHMYNGKPITELNSGEYAAYLMSGF